MMMMMDDDDDARYAEFGEMLDKGEWGGA